MSTLHARVKSRLQRLAGIGREPARLSLNTFVMRKGLWRLPILVRRQRRLEGRVARYEAAVKREKATRDEIDALLRKLGLAHGEGVTCLGYDVVHNERAGRTWVDAEKLREIGVSPVDITWATRTGERAYFATVRPMKGAEVAA